MLRNEDYIVVEMVGVDSIFNSCLIDVISVFSFDNGTVGDDDSFSRLTCLNFFDDDDEDDVEECEPGDVETFGLILGGSSIEIFGDVCSVFGGFGIGNVFDTLFIELIVVERSRSICSCCCRNELRKCSRCIKAFVIADESRFGKRLDEPLLRNIVGSRFPGK